MTRQVMVWADINQDGPTHQISLEGAREDRRVELAASVECKG